jgi:aminoglycoside phosphotransferase (APT) family kinase protein
VANVPIAELDEPVGDDDGGVAGLVRAVDHDLRVGVRNPTLGPRGDEFGRHADRAGQMCRGVGDGRKRVDEHELVTTLDLLQETLTTDLRDRGRHSASLPGPADTLGQVPEWDAEIVVDEQLARRLIRQFPDVKLHSLRPLAEGWDNTVWLADEQWVFRFPRRALAVAGIAREMALLPLLSPLLPHAIPTPRFFGEPADGFPWPFFGSRLLPGREACDVRLDDHARLQIGRDLAAFLQRLHSVDVAEAVDGSHDLPLDPNGRTDMSDRVPKVRQQLDEVERRGLWRVPLEVERVLEEAEALEDAAPVSVVHGDLHFRHVLVADGSELSGVIDWIDLCRADPSIDLLLFWSFLPPRGRGVFLDVYGDLTDEQLLRARVLAFSLCAILATYADAQGLANVEREAVEGLARTSSR